jgi:hypothetical protein
MFDYNINISFRTANLEPMEEENNPKSSYDLVPYRTYSVIVRLLAVGRTAALPHMPDDVARSELAHSSH